MNQKPLAEIRPMPLGGWWLLIAAGVAQPEVYLYSGRRWWVRDDSVYPNPLEYWVIEWNDGSMELMENVF